MEKTEDNPISDGPKKAQKPQDAGWYVAVVRVNCEKRIAIDVQDVLDNKAIWFEYWVPTKRTFVVDRRTNKRKEKDRVFLSTFIFCHVSRKDLNEIRFRSDVYKMLTMPGSKDILPNPRRRVGKLPPVRRVCLRGSLRLYGPLEKRPKGAYLRRQHARHRSLRAARERQKSRHRLRNQVHRWRHHRDRPRTPPDHRGLNPPPPKRQIHLSHNVVQVVPVVQVVIQLSSPKTDSSV